MNDDLFEWFKCACGAPVRSKYKAAPGAKPFVYYCDPCGVKAYAARVNRPPVDREPVAPVK